MNPWLVTKTPAREQAAWAQDGSFLFATQAWGNVLEGLGCRVVYAWNRELGAGVVVPIFRMGPVQVGFLGFPVAGEAFDRLDAPTFTRYAEALARAAGCHVVRGIQSMRPDADPDGVALPDVWIENLGEWPGSRGKRIAKDLAYASRMLVDGSAVVESLRDPNAIWAMYRHAVLGHGGKVRYSGEYFRRLTLLCDGSAMARGVSCIDAKDETAGFAVLVRNGAVGYYLHGAVRDDARGLGVGDLLLARLIELARGMELRRFDLMASPIAQPGLVRYKNKWGDHQGFALTRDVGCGPVGRALCWIGGRLG